MNRLALAASALGLAAVLASGACPRATPKPPAPAGLSLGGVSISRLAEGALPAGPRVQGRRGDWLVETDGVRLVVEAERGAIVDVVSRDWKDDALTTLSPVVFSGTAELTFSPTSIESVDVGGRAALRITRHDRVRGLALITDVLLVPGRSAVELSSTLRNVGRDTHRELALGDRVSWLGRAPFAPGLGFVEKEQRASLSWFARPGDPQSYALVFPGRSANVRFVNTLRGPSEQVALSAPFDLPPGAAAEHRRLVLALRGDLAKVAAAAWTALGDKLGSASGTVSPMPDWARLVARDAAGKSVLESDVSPDGSFELPLPVGSYRVELSVPGGTDTTGVRIEPGKRSALTFVVPKAAHIAYLVTDAEGAAIAARLVLRGIAPTPDPVLGPWHLASGANNVAYTLSGSGVLAVPPGRYAVVVTAGIERTIAELTADVSAERGATLRAALERVVDTEGWMACDFHLHAEPSGDSEVPLADRVTSLVAEGIELAVATDHNHVTDYAPTVSALAVGDAIRTLPGVEITTPRWGHFNAFPYPPDAGPPPYVAEAPSAIFEHVRRISPGAVVQVNHPRMPVDIGYFDLGKLDARAGTAEREGFSFSFDTIEVWNGFELGAPAVVDKNLRDWWALLDGGRRYTAVGNSDSHALAVQWAGYPRTYVKARDAAGVTDALKHGAAIVTNGPFIDLRVQGEGPGGRVLAREGRVRVEVAVRSAPWVGATSVELVVNGELVPLAEELSIERDSYVLAIARGTTPLDPVLPGSRARPMAFTNPVFVRVSESDGGP